MATYYNEIDPRAAAWIRELIKQGLVAPGDVDERSIEDVTPNEIRGYTQCHFFAGIAVWSYALRRAGWSDDRPVWTGSCPCQPFSAAGKGEGFADERHLWPAWFHLIDVLRPVTVFGEQVSSKDGLAWLDLVHNDLEGADYALRAVDIPACSVGAPHRRNRFFFVADAEYERRNNWSGVEGRRADYDNGRIAAAGSDRDIRRIRADIRPDSSSGVVEITATFGRRGWSNGNSTGSGGQVQAAGRSTSGKLDNAVKQGLEGLTGYEYVGDKPGRIGANEIGSVAETGPANGFWANADWIYCRDETYRAVEPGTFPLADGPSARMGRLRGYGNAINAEVAIAFIESYLDTKRCK